MKEYTIQRKDRTPDKKMNQSMDEPEEFIDKTPAPNHIRNEDDEFDSGPGTHDYRDRGERESIPTQMMNNQSAYHNSSNTNFK